MMFLAVAAFMLFVEAGTLRCSLSFVIGILRFSLGETSSVFPLYDASMLFDFLGSC